jgi:hypothetical protein
MWCTEMFAQEAMIAGGLQVMGPTSLIMPAIVITLSAAWLWFAWFANRNAWLDN